MQQHNAKKFGRSFYYLKNNLFLYFCTKKIMKSIILVDDDGQLRIDFEDYFNNYDRNVKCVLTTDNIDELLKFQKLVPDYILLDIGLYAENTLKYICKIKSIFTSTELIIYSIYEDTDFLLKAIISGANGYLSKKVTLYQIEEYLNMINNGGAALSSDMARKILDYFQINKSKSNEYYLTERENQILKLLSEGWTYKKIGNSLFLSLDGVRYYIKSIYTKLNVNTKIEAINKYNIDKNNYL